ncbi:MAG: YihA family ribosome biogenesis GTP-binding protein [Prevotellaceae bacterium]|nr:YihA family ribosome biogenesis GTP-binding protein [Candidatus Minthosoma equi]
MKITSATYVGSKPRADMCPQDGRAEYAFIGRSNVGKSSLINALCDRKALAKTSSTPGKTMCINHFLINDSWYIVDLPGYGYAQRSKKEQEGLKNMISHYVLDREQLTCLFVLIDIRHDPQRVDLAFLNFLGENGVPFAIVFTKADKLASSKIHPTVEKYLDTLREQWEELPPHFITSSANKTGREELLNYIESINKELETHK